MFGEVLFSGSRFIRRILCPLLVVAAGSLLWTVDDGASARGLIATAAAACGLLLAIALYDMDRFAWTARSATGIVFLFSLLYLLDEVLLSGMPWRWFGDRGEPSPRNAVAAFIVFGPPSLWHTLFGRFSLRPEEKPPGENAR